jgi:glycerophosphoryl diester phosphodiesterase
MIEVTGHRGARGLAPENTLAAFGKALELGCNAVELDIQRTRDGALAVIHDMTIDRTTNGSGPVLSYTMSELKSFDAGQGERIPGLEEVFRLLSASDMKIQIELKGTDTEELAAAMVKRFELPERVIFTSFFHRRVLKAKEILPGVRTGILITCNPVDPLEMLRVTGADNLHVNHTRIDAQLVETVHSGDRKIVAWGNIVEMQEIDRLVGLGVDAIGSDRPDIVLKRLRELSE